ncbi:hypothetical protein [Enterococcus ureasiticus]|uniref:Uncharacterized protein n=1 Tax=Enterococcus ureasiticus TaxID=903984 RepID=A0A1E5GHG2_9ENTE|nr:hypothetical protein [Enterococcus ureasiticus]OEG12035.1 hypothetical protein BCR21_07300 [Enterococcus ureasiticus]
MKIKNKLDEVVASENIYEESVENFDILTERMNDDFIPYRVEQNVMMWLDEEGVLGEIECIFPVQLDEEISLVKSKNTLVQNGFPLIDTEKSVEVPVVRVFKNKEYFILYFSELELYDKSIISKNLSFYINNNELIAIKAEIS